MTAGPWRNAGNNGPVGGSFKSDINGSGAPCQPGTPSLPISGNPGRWRA